MANDSGEEKNMNLLLKGNELRRVRALMKYYGLVKYRALSRKALQVLWDQTFGFNR